MNNKKNLKIYYFDVFLNKNTLKNKLNIFIYINSKFKILYKKNNLYLKLA
jgi:hypothetical protein